MAHNTKSIVTDKDGNPISQYYNPAIDAYEPVEGAGGGNAVILYNEDGTVNNSLSLIPILDKLSQLTGTVIDENTRKTNEVTRQASEVDRVSNEDIRTANELLRIESEDERIDAEQNRQTTIEYFKVWEEYNGSKTYHPLNKVTYQGSSYICIAESEGNLPTDIDYWLMIAQKGQDGDGTGDMLKSVYDTNNSGVVDNAEKLGGKLPGEYAAIADIPTQTSDLENDSEFITIDEVPPVDLSGLMPKSGGVLENYRESKVDITNTSGNIVVDLSQGNIFEFLVDGACEISFLNNHLNGTVKSFTLNISILDDNAYPITWSNDIKWNNEEIPEIKGKSPGSLVIFVLTFMTLGATKYAGGLSWEVLY